MDFISYALAKKALDAATEGIKITNMKITEDGRLEMTLSTGDIIDAGKMPTSDMQALEMLEERLEELKQVVVETDGGTITNATITLAQDPTEDMQAATKKYVDSKNLQIFTAKTEKGFPTVGMPNVIYKTDDGTAYIWTVSNGYEVLCEAQSSGIENITLINGGKANARN